MDAAEVEFLAEKEMVTIIPNFSLDKIYLIGVRALAGHLPEAPAGGTGVRERPGLWGLCGRRLVPLCSHVSEGKPGGGFGVPSPRGLRGPGWGEVRSREAWAGGSPGGPRLPGVLALPARSASGNRAQVRCQVRCQVRTWAASRASVTTGACLCICAAICTVPVLFLDSCEVQ